MSVSLEVRFINSHKGHGVFTTKRIRTGALIEFCPLLTLVKTGTLVPWEYSTKKKGISAIYGGLAHFYNHSEWPNVVLCEGPSTGFRVVALFDIPKNQELCFYYGFSPEIRKWHKNRNRKPA